MCAWGAAEGAAALVKKIRLYIRMEESTHIFPGKPRILLIAPILAHADLDNRDVIERWRSYPQKSRGFAAAYAAHDRMALLRVLLPMEKAKREQLLPALQQLRACICGALTQRG